MDPHGSPTEAELLFGAAASTAVLDEPSASGPHLGPAEAFDGGVASISEHTGLWYSVPNDARPCPFCNLAVDDQHCVAILDGEWRWAHPTCTLTAKRGKSDIVPGAPWKRRDRSPCAQCGGRWKEDHAHTYDGVFCDDACSIEYQEPLNA